MLQFELEALQLVLVEDSPLGHADAVERLLEGLVFDVVVTLEVDLGDRRPFADLDDEHVATPQQLDIVEKTGGIELANDLGAAIRIETLADVDRQIAEHRADRDLLVADDLDILDDEALRARRGAHQQQQQCTDSDPAFQTYSTRRNKSLYIATDIRQNSTRMPIFWPMISVCSETGLPLKISIR